MALRVLLADESSTIKKVMQLALADFAVEVKSVPVGLDVLPVAKSFKPDIVFADVLLTKRTGYEVCADLKEDSETRHIPVVLMWSGFMEIDEARVSQCEANGRLEKPFDAEHLRNLVNSLVKKAEENPVSSFLTFPQMPDMEERPADAMQDLSLSDEDLYAIPDDTSEVHLPSVSADEEFAAVPLTMPKDLEDQEDGEWSHQDLNKFKIQIPQDADENDFASKFMIPQDDEVSIDSNGDFEEISFDKNETPVMKSVKDKMIETLTQTQTRSNGPAQAQSAPNSGTAKGSATQPKMQQKIDINADMVEKVLREEAREVLESICWKILPEIAERVVREEINKILRDAEKNI